MACQSDKLFPTDQLRRVSELIEPWFCFSLVWSVGATCDNDSRIKFDRWMRDAMQRANVSQRSMCSTLLLLLLLLVTETTPCFIKSGPLCIFAITFSNVDRLE